MKYILSPGLTGDRIDITILKARIQFKFWTAHSFVSEKDGTLLFLPSSAPPQEGAHAEACGYPYHVFNSFPNGQALVN